MERHKCKLCFRSFSNGRALGGHMRSHMMSLPLPRKEVEQSPPTPLLDQAELGEEPEFASSPSQSNSDSDEKGLYYGLRENPKKSVRLVDPEFSFAVVDSGSVVIVHDRESGSESSRSLTRKRSQRKPSPKTESEPASSVSDTTTEEDVAFCLMMMSRDTWHAKRSFHEETDEEEDEEEEEEEEDESEEEDEEEEFEELAKSSRINGGSSSRNKYRCETCDRAFRSYQALGGHRASHKKIRLSSSDSNHPGSDRVNASEKSEKKVHQCPVCSRVFASGQALGGHKRSHVLAGNSVSSAKLQTPASVSPVGMDVKRLRKLGERLIDLNIPAQGYDEDDDYEYSQIELSAVSDAEFVNSIRQ